MTDKIVYTCTGRVKQDRVALQRLPVPRNWESEVRVSPERHEASKRSQREYYRIKAGLLGMTLAGYCHRFGVKL